MSGQGIYLLVATPKTTREVESANSMPSKTTKNNAPARIAQAGPVHKL